MTAGYAAVIVAFFLLSALAGTLIMIDWLRERRTELDRQIADALSDEALIQASHPFYFSPYDYPRWLK